MKKSSFKVLTEVITADNVLEMAEMIAIVTTKRLVGWVGSYAYKVHTNLYADIKNKRNSNYTFSDSYELVQSVALFLCNHFGERLDDFYRVNQLGGIYTIKKECYQIIDSIVCKGYRNSKKYLSLEDISLDDEPRYELQEPVNFEESYQKVDNIIAAMDLTEMQASVLNYRMSGLSFPEIGRYLNRCRATVFEHLGKAKMKYLKYIQGLE